MSSELDNSGTKQLTTYERDKIPIYQKALNGLVIYNKTTKRLEKLKDRQWLPIAGENSFAGLNDTPNGFPSGSSGKVIRVNLSNDGLEFFDPTTASPTTYTIQIGDSSATSFNIVHNLNVKFVQVSILETATGHQVEADVTIVSSNNVTIEFTKSPNVNEFTVIITK